MKPLYLKGTQTPDIPKYIKNIACRLSEQPGPYMYRLNGVNQYRPAYGIFADLEALAKWAERYGAELVTHRTNTQPGNYYAIIELTDPVCLALERAGLLWTQEDSKNLKTARWTNPSARTPEQLALMEKREYWQGRKEY